MGNKSRAPVILNLFTGEESHIYKSRVIRYNRFSHTLYKQVVCSIVNLCSFLEKRTKSAGKRNDRAVLRSKNTSRSCECSGAVLPGLRPLKNNCRARRRHKCPLVRSLFSLPSLPFIRHWRRSASSPLNANYVPYCLTHSSATACSRTQRAQVLISYRQVHIYY